MPEAEIGIDLRMWTHPGIGRYIRELTRAMLALEDPGRFRFFAFAGDEQSIFSALGPVRCEKAVNGIYSAAEQRELRNFSKNCRLLHVPHFNAPVFCASRLVVTLHDLIYLKESRFSGSVLGKLYVGLMIRGIEKNARAVITVSDFTRRDLTAAFPKLADRVRVIHEAAASHFNPSVPKDAEAVQRKHGISQNYLLFVGSLKAHKNLNGLLDAFARLTETQKGDAQLVIVGRRDPKEKALLERLGRSGPSVCYLGEKSDAQLAELYRAAKALIIPSFWEGFGLTAVEAMACGTPVLASERASLPEVVGSAGILFDPERTDRMAEILSEVLKDGHLRAELSRKGLERSRQFSWEKAARETLNVYKKALE